MKQQWLTPRGKFSGSGILGRVQQTRFRAITFRLQHSRSQNYEIRSNHKLFTHISPVTLFSRSLKVLVLLMSWTSIKFWSELLGPWQLRQKTYPTNYSSGIWTWQFYVNKLWKVTHQAQKRNTKNLNLGFRESIIYTLALTFDQLQLLLVLIFFDKGKSNW